MEPIEPNETTDQTTLIKSDDVDKVIELIEVLRTTAEKEGYPIETYVLAVLSEVALLANKTESTEEDCLIFRNNVAGTPMVVKAYAETT